MRTPHHQSINSNQDGAALMVMLVIMVVGASVFLVSSLSSSAYKAERQEKAAVALAQAKEALVGRAASDDNIPGSLPCPDTDNDGSAELMSGNNCPSYIGRLPWRTLKLPDLRDDSGERLWYALSTNFRDDNSARPLNSDTQGLLSIVGNTVTNNVAAIVFAPGAPLCGKSHNSNNVTDYLEAGDGTTTSYTLKPPSSDCNNSPYNDNVLAITANQIFQPVEKRVGGEIKRILNTYFAAWGAFPFAAPFGDPSISAFTGQSFPATFGGLLPVGNNVLPTWAGIPSVSFSGGGTYSFCELRPDSTTGTIPDARWRCIDIAISAGETITITGKLNNVGRGLWRPHNINNACEVRARDSLGTTTLVTSQFAPNSVTITRTLNPDGSANIVFRATGKAGGTMLQRIEFRDILAYNTDIQTYDSAAPSCPLTSSSPVIPKWLFNDPTNGNNWHQVAYYAISPGYAPGGGNACNPLPGSPSCLTLNGSGGGNDMQAIVAMTGVAIASQMHPQSTITNYLEGENATPIPPAPADYIFENKNRSSVFNDQVIVIAP